jgi:4-hydroxy-4-methyl-2-oxoglutarate aldolase
VAEAKKESNRLERALIKRATRFSSATLHEASGRRGALPYEIKPLGADMVVCGPALTVSSPPMDNLMLHKAIYAALPGDVLVVGVSGVYEAGYWGEIMTFAAQQRGVAGLVIDGCVRDGALIQKMRFPVFGRGLSIRGTTKDGEGSINFWLRIGDVVINPGDLIFGDGDGVVVVPQKEVVRVLQEAEKREEKEKEIKKELAAGKSTLDYYRPA